MPRSYTVVFEAVAVSAAQDLVQVIGATGKILEIVRAWVGPTDTTLVTAQSISTRCRFLPATVSNGSGGSSPTPQPFDPGDSAASFSAKANSTSKATTSGTASVLSERGDHIYQGAEFNFPDGRRPTVGPSESFVFELLSSVSGTVHLSGGVEVLERGG